MTNAELDQAVGKAKGWVDYPSDSIESRTVWLTQPGKVPFGEAILKRNYTPTINAGQWAELLDEMSLGTVDFYLTYCTDTSRWRCGWLGRNKATGRTIGQAVCKAYCRWKDKETSEVDAILLVGD